MLVLQQMATTQLFYSFSVSITILDSIRDKKFWPNVLPKFRSESSVSDGLSYRNAYTCWRHVDILFCKYSRDCADGKKARTEYDGVRTFDGDETRIVYLLTSAQNSGRSFYPVSTSIFCGLQCTSG